MVYDDKSWPVEAWEGQLESDVAVIISSLSRVES